MGLFVQPVCLTAQQETHVICFSVKAAQWHAKQPSGSVQQAGAYRASVLLVHKDTLLHHALCIEDSGPALYRFTVPAGVLEPSVVTAYVALCNDQGSIHRVVDSGKLLVLGADAAAEVQNLFKQTTTQVQQLLSPSAGGACSSTLRRSRGSLQTTLSSLLGRIGASRLRTDGAMGAAAASVTVHSVAAGSSASMNQQQRLQAPDAAALYAYEHFHVPLLHQWDLVFAESDADVLATPASLREAMLAGAAARSQIMQLLSFLLEHELWSCSLLVLGKHPWLAAHAQRVGLRQDDDEEACPTVLDQMRRGLQPARRLSNSGPLQMQQMPHPMQQAAIFQQLQQQQQQRQQCMLPQQPQQMLAFQRRPPQQGGQAPWLQQQQLLLQTPAEQVLLQQQQAQVLQQHMMLLRQMHQQQQQLGMVPPSMQRSTPQMPAAAAATAQTALERTRTPAGSDETVESASEILVRLGLLQQARGEQEQLQQEALAQEALEQEALAVYMADEQDLQGLSADSMWESAAWSVPVLVAAPAVQPTKAAQTAPLNVIQFDLMDAVGAGAVAPTAATAAATQTVEDLTGLVAHQHFAAHDRRAAFEHSPHQEAAVADAAAAAGPAAAGSAADVAAEAGAVPAEVVGLRQRCPAAARTGGSLFSKQRKLSWEEEQPEPVPLAPSPLAAPYRLADAAAAAGWYPNTWQLPEPSNSLLLGQGGYVQAQGFSSVQLPRPNTAEVVDPAGGQLCSYGGLAGYLADDPYTEPSYAANMSSTMRQHRQQQQQQEAEAQQQQHWLQEEQQQEEDAQSWLEQQQHEEEVLQQQQWVQQQQQQQQQVNEEAQAVLQQQCLEQQQQREGEQAGVQQTGAAASQAGSAQASTAASEFEPVSCSSKGASFESADCSKYGSSSSRKAGFSSDACVSSGSSGPSHLLLQSPLGGLALQRPWELLAVSAYGFQDPCLEAAYLVFKNHGCSILDATAGFICTSMLLTSTLRSLNLRSDCSAWLQLVTMAIYSMFFFLPYIVMKLQLQVFLRLREQLLVFGRDTGAILLAVMALGYLPMVQVWKNVIVSSLSLQIQNGFILPSCQQVRLPAALMIAAVHIPADAIWLAVGRPFRAALLHSVLMQLSSVTVALVFDAWCRVRFVHRYSGMATGGQQSALPLQQS